MATHLVFAPVGPQYNGRKDCENIQGQTFGSVDEVRSKIPEGSLVYDLDDYMEDFNAEVYIKNKKWFMSYVTITK